MKHRKTPHGITTSEKLLFGYRLDDAPTHRRRKTRHKLTPDKLELWGYRLAGFLLWLYEVVRAVIHK